MPRFIGALLIILASSLTGFMLSRTLMLRVSQLREIRRGLKLLETEMLYSASFLPSALERVSALLPPGTGIIFKRTAEHLASMSGLAPEEAWHLALRGQSVNMHLKEEDLEILEELGDLFSSVSREDQEKHFRYIQNLLEEREKFAVEDLDKNSRLYQYFGICAGLIVVIFFY